MFDAIVVGARCGGSPAAMLLARHGYRVLLVDRAKFPSDTMQAVYLALRTNPVERDRFFGTLAGTVPIPEYYAPDNLLRIAAGVTAAA